MTGLMTLQHGEVRRARGITPSRRAVIRWAWRLFRREWRQQLLVLGLVVVAVAATVIGATVATNTPAPANSGFGSAQDAATFAVDNPQPDVSTALNHVFSS